MGTPYPPTAAPASAHPAQPILASTLLDLSKTNDKQYALPARLGTSTSIIDNALEGGFDHGCINLISGEPKTGKTTLVLHALATHLLAGPNDAQAAVIDASGAFDVLKFHGLVLARLRERDEATRLRRRANQVLDRDWGEPGFAEGRGAKAEEEAARVLDRVKVIRVFDFIGVMDGVKEVRAELEGRDGARRGGASTTSPLKSERRPQAENVVEAESRDHPAHLTKRLEVADSDEEDPDADMQLSGIGQVQDEGLDPASQTFQEARASQGEHQAEQPISLKDNKISVLVIDNIATVLAPLLKNNYVHAHTLFTPFMRHLTHLTRQHHLCTLITNNTTSLRGYREYARTRLTRSFPSSTSSSSPADPAADPRSTLEAEENPSIFAYNAVNPALGSTFSSCADLHVLMTKVPLERRDATLALNNQGEGHAAGGHAVQTATVMEVMADRYSGRVGQWAAVHITADGSVKPAV